MINQKTTILNTIIETFYFTANLPILSLNLGGKAIGSVGLDKNFFQGFYTNDLSKKILSDVNLKQSNNIKFINLDKFIEIAVVFISSGNTINHYFIIGPYNSQPNNISNNNKYSLCPYRPRISIKYVIDMLKSIVTNHTSFSNDKNEKEINLYIKKAIGYIHKNYEDDLTIDLISKELNINKCYFCSLFKKDTGLTFSNFLNKFRIEKSKTLLRNKSLSILDVAIAVGFNNQNYFSMAFKKELGMTPLQFRREY